MLNISSLYVALADQDDRLVTFYRALFDQQPVIWQPGRYAEFALPGLKLAIFVPKPDHQAEFFGAAPGSLSLCLEVEPLEAAIARLSGLGYPPPGEIISASHGRELYAYDPAGNRLILHETHRPD